MYGSVDSYGLATFDASKLTTTGQFYEQSRYEKLIACYYNGSGLLTHSGQTFFWNPWQFDAHAQRGPMFFLATAVLLS